MHTFPHRYRLTLEAGAAGPALIRGDGLPDLESAAPVEFDGPGDRWSPEHLFVSSILSCFLLTLRAIASASKIELNQVKCGGEGVLDRVDGGPRFTEVILRARASVPAGTDAERVKRVMEKAEKACFVARSIVCPVNLEAEVVEE